MAVCFLITIICYNEVIDCCKCRESFPYRIRKMNKKIALMLLIYALILAGIVVLYFGLYYRFFKAGIPFQDPPLELQISYYNNYRKGRTLILSGFIMILVGLLTGIITRFIYRRKN